MDRTNSTGVDGDIPSSLSSILNEMRSDEIETEDGVIRLDGYADQIESGIRQIIEEWKAVARAQDKAQTVMMEEIERLRAPGSVAAMRDALKRVESELSTMNPRGCSDTLAYVRAALEAPPEPPSDSDKMREALLAIKEINDKRPHDAAGYEINDIIEEALAPEKGAAE